MRQNFEKIKTKKQKKRNQNDSKITKETRDFLFEKATLGITENIPITIWDSELKALRETGFYVVIDSSSGGKKSDCIISFNSPYHNSLAHSFYTTAQQIH